MDTHPSLIRRVRDNADTVAWGEFFSIYQPLILAYARKRGASEHDAADIVQEVFARLVPAMAHFEFNAERGRFRTWLWSVTHNALVDWARRRATRDRAERVWADQNEFLAESDESSDWYKMYHSRILQVALERVRASTQPLTWACFEGRILAGRPASEVASEAGVSVNAVYVNASRLLSRVREECSELQEPVK
jgi:RNA polymerase sigma-70 factor (ECF subfamily)